MMIPDDRNKTKKGVAGHAATQSQPTQQEGQSDGGSGSAQNVPVWRTSKYPSASEAFGSGQNTPAKPVLPAAPARNARSASTSSPQQSKTQTQQPTLPDKPIEYSPNLSAQNVGGVNKTGTYLDGAAPAQPAPGSWARTDFSGQDNEDDDVFNENDFLAPSGSAGAPSDAVADYMAQQREQDEQDVDTDDNEGGGEGRFRDLDDIYNYLYGYYQNIAERNKPESPEQRRKRERMEKWGRIIGGISDMGRALGNLYFTSQYAPDMYAGTSSMSDAINERFDKDAAARDAREAKGQNALWKLYALRNKEAERERQAGIDARNDAYYAARIQDLEDKRDREAELHVAKLKKSATDNAIAEITLAQKTAAKDTSDKLEEIKQRFANGEYKDYDAYINEIAKVDPVLGGKLRQQKAQTDKTIKDTEVSKARAYRLMHPVVRSGGGGGRSSGGGSRGHSGGGRWRSGGGGGSYHGSGGGSKIKTLKNPTFKTSYNLSDWSNTDKWNAFYSDTMYDLKHNFKNGKVWSAIPPGMKAALRNGPKAFKNYYYEVIRQGNNEKVVDILVDVFNKFSNY